MKTLSALGENQVVAALVGQLAPPRADVLVGPGDDAAVIREPGSRWDRLLKTDAVVEGIHFEPDASPRAVGWKALCRAISDLAAMGGEPQYALITIGLRSDTPIAWGKKIYRGLQQAATRYGVDIVGGETVRTTGPHFLSVCLVGRIECGRALLRSGAKRGDAILVTGKLGGSIRGWHLRFTPRLAEGRWLAATGCVHAMMDLSDGLGADLPRLAEASGLAWELDESAVPRRLGSDLSGALHDGEDYELLLTIPQKKLPSLQQKWAREFPKLPLTVIGRMLAKTGKNVHPTGGFQHF